LIFPSRGLYSTAGKQTFENQASIAYMNKSQLKTKIFLLNAIEILLVIALFCFGIYAILYSEHKGILGVFTLIGLYLVNMLGNFKATKIATMQVELSQQQRKDKGYTIV